MRTILGRKLRTTVLNMNINESSIDLTVRQDSSGHLKQLGEASMAGYRREYEQFFGNIQYGEDWSVPTIKLRVQEASGVYRQMDGNPTDAEGVSRAILPKLIRTLATEAFYGEQYHFLTSDEQMLKVTRRLILNNSK